MEPLSVLEVNAGNKLALQILNVLGFGALWVSNGLTSIFAAELNE
jgi:hypothetical protein